MLFFFFQRYHKTERHLVALNFSQHLSIGQQFVKVFFFPPHYCFNPCGRRPGFLMSVLHTVVSQCGHKEERPRFPIYEELTDGADRKGMTEDCPK